MKEFKTAFWVRLSLINLLLVALMGILMRYKIGFEFPYF
jgi:cytochrome bd-type quinol oxidase subunit 1